MLVRYGGSGCTSVPSSSLLRSPSPSPFLITTISNQEEGGGERGERNTSVSARGGRVLLIILLFCLLEDISVAFAVNMP